MALLALKNVGVRTGGTWALWDVNLEINAGEIVGIFGRSGSGKTMLARVLAGLQQSTSGSVVLGDRDNEEPFKVSVALDKPAAASDLTVYENLDMFASLWGMPRRKRAKEIMFLLQLLKLGDWRNSPAGSIPKGAAERMEIARALLADSPMTVIDSLLDTLDPPVFEALWDYILHQRRDELKSFLVLTASAKVAETCQKIAAISRGRIGFIGRPEDFRRIAGEDVIVLGDISNPLIKSRIQEQLSVVIQEEDGFLSFRVANGERMVSELLSEFGGELSCVYLKRPTLEDALEVFSNGVTTIRAGAEERKTS